jgi:hypothetical protein
MCSLHLKIGRCSSAFQWVYHKNLHRDRLESAFEGIFENIDSVAHNKIPSVCNAKKASNYCGYVHPLLEALEKSL